MHISVVDVLRQSFCDESCVSKKARDSSGQSAKCQATKQVSGPNVTSVRSGVDLTSRILLGFTKNLEEAL